MKGKLLKGIIDDLMKVPMHKPVHKGGAAVTIEVHGHHPKDSVDDGMAETEDMIDPLNDDDEDDTGHKAMVMKAIHAKGHKI